MFFLQAAKVMYLCIDAKTIPKVNRTIHHEVKNDADESTDSTCAAPECIAVLDLAENLSSEVTELSTRYKKLQAEGNWLFKQYEIRCFRLKAAQTHNQNLQNYVAQIVAEHENLRAQYDELYRKYSRLDHEIMNRSR